MDPLPPSPSHTPPSLKQSRLFSSIKKIVLSKNQHALKPDILLYSSKLRSRDQPILRQPQKTNPIIWCAAILCMIFSILLIFFGIATLIIFAAIQPRNPAFDTPGATLNTIYFNPAEYINGELTFLANFSNPNRKLDVRFEYLYIELYYSENLVATQHIPPFGSRPGEARLMSVRLVSSSVHLPPNLAMELQKQAQRNRVVYKMKGTFRVKVKMGLIHYSYWLHGECQLEMGSPPNGILLNHSCRTKR